MTEDCIFNLFSDDYDTLVLFNKKIIVVVPINEYCLFKFIQIPTEDFPQ